MGGRNFKNKNSFLINYKKFNIDVPIKLTYYSVGNLRETDVPLNVGLIPTVDAQGG